VIGILGGLFWLAGAANPNSPGATGVFALLALHAYVAVALLFFWRSRSPA